MSEKLKPCPFCGDEAMEREVTYHNTRYYIQCTKCGAGSAFSLSEQGAIDAWNTRAISDSEKFLGKILQEMCDIHNDKISSMNQDNSPAFMIALMREDDIYRTAQKFLQETQS